LKQHDEVYDSIVIWLSYAQEDFDTAQFLFEKTGSTAHVCFHAQQAVEKALKAYIVSMTDDDIPRTHDLEILAEFISAHNGEIIPEEILSPFRFYAVAIRYPQPRKPSHDEACEAIVLSRKVLCLVRELVNIQE
jgi:HEPN domain-containing protein